MCRARRRPCPRWSASSRRRVRPAIVHVASADDHELTDPEISDAPGLPDDLSAALPARHPRRARRSRRRSRSDPVPLSLEPAAGALPRRGPRVPAPEEELRRLHEPQHRPAARRTSTGGDRGLRRRHGRLRRRRDPRLPLPRPPVRFVEDAARGPRRRARGRPARPSGGKMGSRSPLLRRPLESL